MRRTLSILGIIAVACFIGSARAGTGSGDAPRATFVELDLQAEFGGASTGRVVTGSQGRCAARLNVTALAIGNLDSFLQTSSDDVNWYTAVSFGNCAAAPCSYTHLGTIQLLRYARLFVVANGSPSLATVDMIMDCPP